MEQEQENYASFLMLWTLAFVDFKF